MTAILTDESIPYRAVQACREIGLDILSVIEMATGATDHRVAEMTRDQDRVLVTLDADLAARIYKLARQWCPGLILLRARPSGPRALADLMQELVYSEHEILGAYTVVFKHRIRQLPMGQSWKDDTTEYPTEPDERMH